VYNPTLFKALHLSILPFNAAGRCVCLSNKVILPFKNNYMNQANYNLISKQLKKDAKILFATFSGDGHFNPLTGIAVHLKKQGYDVRWYTSAAYQPKLESYNIPFYPQKSATDFANADPKHFSRREKVTSHR
jgi:hypothetical protein